MAHIVILGAGVGGMTMAYEMREQARSQDKVTVISNHAFFQFTPSNPWVAVNWRSRDDITIPVAPYLEKKGIDFIPVGAKRVHPEANEVELDDGRRIPYDFLIIATGPKLAFDEVPGLGPAGHTQSVCHVDHAVEAGKAWDEFVKDPGPIVVGAVQGASCYGPAYEFAMIMDTDLRRRKHPQQGAHDLRHRRTLYRPPGPGRRGRLERPDGIGHAPPPHQMDLQRQGHQGRSRQDVRRRARRGRQGEEGARAALQVLHDAAGLQGHRRGVRHRGPDQSARLHRHRPFQRNPRFNNVYGVGVCVAIPPVEATPVPTGAPKTGYMIESMVTATAHNIRAVLDGKEPYQKATWNAVCLADFGDTGAAFVALPQIPPRNVNWFKEGKWVHLAKIAFEKYFIRKMKKGTTEPIYEKYVMGVLGIKKLH
jgi:sulfide:quinone oxidoreductase